MQRLDVDPGLQHAIDITHRGQTPLKGCAANVLGEHRAAHRVDDEVDALAVRGLHHMVIKISVTCAQGYIQSERFEARQFVGRARRADDFGAQCLGHLQGGHTDARRHAVDQQPLACGETALQHQHVIDHQKGQRNAGRFLPRQRGRHRHGFTHIHHRVLRKSRRAAPHHAVTCLQRGHSRAQSDNVARAFHADGFRRARLAVQPVADDEFTPVKGCGAHAHQHLTRAGFGLRHVAQVERGVGIGHLHPVRLHEFLLSFFVMSRTT